MSDKTAALLTIQDFFNMEIGLKPTDGDAIMVKAHILCSGSTFFRDMLTLPQSSSKGHSDKIMVDLDVTQAILKMIVDMINDKQIPQKPTSAQFFTAIDFCDRYAMDGLRDRFLLKLSDYVEDEPWKCFCIASDHHLPELATGAVSSFAHDSRIDGLRLLSFPAHVAEEAAPNYVAALVRAMYSYSRAFLHAEQRLKSEDWQVVSQHFSKAIPFPQCDGDELMRPSRVFDYKIDLVMMMNTGASLPLNIIWIFDVDAAEERDELAHNLMAIDQVRLAICAHCRIGVIEDDITLRSGWGLLWGGRPSQSIPGGLCIAVKYSRYLLFHTRTFARNWRIASGRETRVSAPCVVPDEDISTGRAFHLDLRSIHFIDSTYVGGYLRPMAARSVGMRRAVFVPEGKLTRITSSRLRRSRYYDVYVSGQDWLHGQGAGVSGLSSQTTVLAFPEPISERQNSPIIPTYVSITSTGVSDIRSDNMENVQLSPSTAYRPQSTNAARSQEPDQIAMRKTCNISPHVRASSFCHVYSGQTPRRRSPVMDSQGNPLLQDILLQPTSGPPIAVKAYLLYAHSTVFHDMIDLTLNHGSGQNTTNLEDYSLDINGTTDEVTFLVELLNGRRLSGQETWAQMKATIGTCEKYGFDLHRQLIVLSLYDRTNLDPWEIFCLASHYNMLSLARKAIASFSENPNTTNLSLATLTGPQLASVNSEYMAALVRAMSPQTMESLQVRIRNVSGQTFGPTQSWQLVSERFTLNSSSRNVAIDSVTSASRCMVNHPSDVSARLSGLIFLNIESYKSKQGLAGVLMVELKGYVKEDSHVGRNDASKPAVARYPSETYLGLPDPREGTPPLYAQVKTALDLCEKYGFELYKEHLILHLFKFTEDEPWAIFCIASEYNVLALARKAITSFAKHPETRIFNLHTLGGPHIASVDPNCMAGLVRLLADRRLAQRYDSAGQVVYNTYTESDWKTISKGFKPVWVELLTFLERYADKTADILLKSNDEKLFRVHSYILKAHSTVFRDMISLPSTNDKKDPITLDMTSVQLEIFLDFMHETDPTLASKWADCMTLIEHLKQYGCESLVERVVVRLGTVADQAPWEVFALASQHDNLGLALTALRHFGMDHRTSALNMSNVSKAMASSVTSMYMTALAGAMEGRVISFRGEVRNWGEVSGKFTLPK
ncbi:hypothetical protein TREMEDRAFT_63864 [Tremella mesenterica DSM 1558]|uniref:uncharacterized protein n=1 Tax=Tremella mesenterica (strain ATCC 24925 / CBS 8224 / DSM 1558 / NBRC 9311 / NRRL Y-6157 / RJB 2259-6 / UBC 559-6) TaxID=578456 RepID=UPI0003F48D13|nr:uncharacterized protein TREMEDRAFT_63864 [Tremella mesenterica DSM 1558]EIW67980.1 hypothetical protein TREMEDRAFT_63864 [Tremella mesenterica DSM 1558]